jgi:membrane protease YdiL (CAAX protease family)
MTGAMRNPWLRALVGFVGGLLLFLVVAWALKLLLGSTVSGSAVLSQIVLKTAMVLIALLVWKLLGRSFPEMGWRRADWWNRSYLIWFVIAAVAMMAGSVVMVLLGLRHPVASQLGFLQLVLVVWLLSSFSEEVYVRGLVQSWVADRDDAYGINSSFQPSVVASALLFVALHVPLMLTPIGVKGGTTIVLATFGVGIACAVLRARSRSLWPAIACHVIGNVAGVPGGILGVILYRLTYGRLPEFLTAG